MTLLYKGVEQQYRVEMVVKTAGYMYVFGKGRYSNKRTLHSVEVDRSPTFQQPLYFSLQDVCD